MTYDFAVCVSRFTTKISSSMSSRLLGELNAPLTIRFCVCRNFTTSLWKPTASFG